MDNSAAFDRVRWDFMHRLLQEMGFPEEFRETVRTMYRGVNFTVKMNGITGEKQDQTQGVRQGCGVSPLLFLLVQEALLIHIRSSDKVKGVVVKGDIRVKDERKMPSRRHSHVREHRKGDSSTI